MRENQSIAEIASGYYIHQDYARNGVGEQQHLRSYGEIPRRKALVLDDEASIRFLVKQILEEELHLDVRTGENGFAGIEELQQGAFDLIISDVRMPKMDGLDFLDWIRTHVPEQAQRFLFMTGDSGGGENAVRLQDSCLTVMEKPFDLNHLVQSCRQILPQKTRV